jgi:hypothetical protein
VWVEDSTGVLRAVGKLGVGGKGEERVIEGWSDQSTVYSQLGYIWTLILELKMKDKTVN